MTALQLTTLTAQLKLVKEQTDASVSTLYKYVYDVQRDMIKMDFVFPVTVTTKFHDLFTAIIDAVKPMERSGNINLQLSEASADQNIATLRDAPAQVEELQRIGEQLARSLADTEKQADRVFKEVADYLAVDEVNGELRSRTAR